MNDVLPAGDRFVIADHEPVASENIEVDGTLTRIDPPSSSGSPTGGSRGLAWLGQPDGDTCASAWIRTDHDWRSVRPSAGTCARPVSIGFGNQATSFVDHGVALPDGFLVLSQGTKADDEALFAIRPTNVVSADPPAGAAAVPPQSAIPLPPMGALTPHRPCPTGP